MSYTVDQLQIEKTTVSVIGTVDTRQRAATVTYYKIPNCELSIIQVASHFALSVMVNGQHGPLPFQYYHSIDDALAAVNECVVDRALMGEITNFRLQGEFVSISAAACSALADVALRHEGCRAYAKEYEKIMGLTK